MPEHSASELPEMHRFADAWLGEIPVSYGARPAIGLWSPPVTSAPRRPLASTPFGDDDGSADPRLEAALAAYGRGEGGSADVLAALAASRLLIPVVAVPAGEPEDEQQPPGAATGQPIETAGPPAGAGAALAGEKLTDMATVLTTGRDGRRGLLAFTCLEAMRRWNPEARPSPVPTRSAAEAALADGADALVIDLAGPVMFSVDAAELRSLASGWRPLGTWPGVVPPGATGDGDPGGAGAAGPAGAAPVDRPAVRVRHAGARVRRTGGRVWRRVRRAMIR